MEHDEGDVTNAVHSVERSSPQSKVVVISFDVNSNFFYGKGDFADDKKIGKNLLYFSNFKPALLNHLFHKESPSPCRWSIFMKEADLQVRFERLINSVHAHYFWGCDTLKAMERSVLQILLYVEIADEELCANEYDYFTASCRSTMDRGPLFYALWHLKHLLMRKRHREPDEIVRLSAMYFVNAYLFGNRLPSTLNIFQAAAKLMLQRGPMPRGGSN